jgi:hypothetical protein
VRVQEVTPNGENATLEELEVAMEAAPNKRSYVRLAAIRALLLGVPRAQVCRLYHRSDRLIRLWLEMFNRDGIDALAGKPRTGRPPKVRWERLRDPLARCWRTLPKRATCIGPALSSTVGAKSQLALELGATSPGYRT